MKKLVWIYSVNTRGGILKSSGAGMIWSRSKKLQEQLRIKVEPNGTFQSLATILLLIFPKLI